uniref:SMODS and SLOG-associating 2TM effector domain-containing protein n=1 Tax=Candidatus Kentrum eta TaxID=2126337 RepID=A0A450V8J8_9GAMM|nr:MAG: hypothetical protein BECKH772A_GA0070896_100629 [Candidatus Kentron sp. H]VFJ94565.1 MAG: hypothetical protein BECKH772B_GA0070898_100639 [Candidatus Kentron sp. H]VFK01108.1 MAG: hypothetical protein BECKH772C_GA0070978_100589 [Candidatus Kentron sp. H]
MNDGIKKATWESMLTADMNARYWKYLVYRYIERDKWLKIFLALMTSGTVAAWGLWEEMRWLWQALSFASAALAISLPFWDYQRKIEDMSALGGTWGKLRMDYEDLWREVKKHPDPESLKDSYRQLRKTEAILQEREINLPYKKVLLRRCQNEVKKARSLN